MDGLKNNKYIIIFLLAVVAALIFCTCSKYCVLKEKLRENSCFSMQRQIQKAIKEYKKDHKKKKLKFIVGEIIDQKELIDKGYLRKNMRCPDNIKYIFSEDKSVYCKKHKKIIK